MSDALLPYYDRELDALRRLAAELPRRTQDCRQAGACPGNGRRSACARLLEGVAFWGRASVTVSTTNFPNLRRIAGVLYPLPCPDPLGGDPPVSGTARADAAGPASGRARVESEPVQGETCRFRTAWPQTLWPITIESVRLSGLPLNAPANPLAAGALSVLRIVLRCSSGQANFAQLGIDRLRFFLRGAANVALPLYELLGARVLAVSYAEGPSDPAAVSLPASAIELAGFGPEEGLLPWPARSFAGFRLLSEYFAFPEKFLFVDFTRLDAKALLSETDRLEIFVYFDRALPELERTIGADTLALGCTPVVNLFPQRCEPIRLTHTDIEYRIVPDARRHTAMEVWQVERVRETLPDGSSRPWWPFYRLTHGDRDSGGEAGFYHLARRPTAAPLTGSEVYIAPYDPEFDADAPSGTVLSIDALCLNRDLPVGAAFWRRPPGDAAGRAAAERGPAFLPDGAEHTAAPAAAGAPVLASRVRPVAGAPVDRRRRRGSGGVARGAASL